MKNSQSNSYRIFARWAAFSYQNAIWIILLVLLLTSLSTVYTVNNLGVHTDTTDMLSEDVPFRANNIHYKKSFSQYEDTFLLVLDAPTPEQVHQAAKRFTNYLQKDSTQFSNTYYLMGEPFFEQNGFFFKSQSELGRIADYLAAAQPLVARIAESPTLYTFSSVLKEAVDELRAGRQLELETIFSGVSATLNAHIAGKSRALSWQALFGGEAQKETYQELIVVQPKLDYSQEFDAEEPINAIRIPAKDMGFSPNAVDKLSITGEEALHSDKSQDTISAAKNYEELA